MDISPFQHQALSVKRREGFEADVGGARLVTRCNACCGVTFAIADIIISCLVRAVSNGDEPSTSELLLVTVRYIILARDLAVFKK